MTHYKTRLEKDLQAIRTRLAHVAEVVRESVEEAVDALVETDSARLYQVMLNDPHVNRETRAIDTMCHAFIARHLPAAGNLRFVSSALRLSIALERIGDYAVTVARVGVKLETSPEESLMNDLRKVANRACKMLANATTAFINNDPELAKETAKMSRKIDKRHDKFFDKIINVNEPILLQTIRLLTIVSKLERVSDQAKNMCEEALFTTTGETKRPKVSKILFVDEKNNFLSPLAAAIAAKAFPDSGRYSSAGWTPAEAVDPRLEQAAEVFALDVDEFQISQVQPFRQAMAEYTVIVAINAGDELLLSPIPFHSILLRWTVDEALPVDEKIRLLTRNINDIMTKLHGEDAG
jgi:phosphate transport system protein